MGMWCSMIKGKITLIYDNGGDWIGIYVDGKLIAENHNFQEDDLLSHLEIEYDVHWVNMPGSRLPENLDEILPKEEEEKATLQDQMDEKFRTKDL